MGTGAETAEEPVDGRCMIFGRADEVATGVGAGGLGGMLTAGESAYLDCNQITCTSHNRARCRQSQSGDDRTYSFTHSRAVLSCFFRLFLYS